MNRRRAFADNRHHEDSMPPSPSPTPSTSWLSSALRFRALSNAAMAAAAGATTVASVAFVAGGGIVVALLSLVKLSVIFFLVVWLSPALSALVVRVIITEVIRLSGAMADEDQEVGRGIDSELGTGLGWEGVRGRVAVQQWEWHHQQQSRQEHEQDLRQRTTHQRQQTGSPNMDRRVNIEWEGGQMFLVIRRPIASKWLIDLVNRYMHGPIPMKIETCRAEMLRACLSPAQILRIGSFKATIVGLRVFARRTHEDEWDEEYYYEKAIKFRRWAADYVQQLIEGTYGRKLKRWGFIVDSLINNLTFETRDLHLRIDDRWNGHCFGLFFDVFDCKPGKAEPESMGATPHEFSLSGLAFYVDPHNDIALSPQCTALTIEEGTFRVEFPNIFRTLILNREIMPGGRGKRLRVRGDFSGFAVNIQANQMRTFLFSLLGTFCPYKYSAWKAAIRAQAAADCRPVSVTQRCQYLEIFGTRGNEKILTALQKKERLAKLAELERHMSYRDILILRKESRGWRLKDMGDEPPADKPPLDPEFMAGIEENDPQYKGLARFAARIQGLQLSAWEKSTYLREIMVETVVVRQAEMRLYTKADKDRDGPEDKAFQTPLQAVLLSSKMEARFRMFLSRTKASNRLHSRGANGVDGEPALPWLMAGGSLQHPVLLDEATATRLGYEAPCILAPAKIVFAPGDGSGVRGRVGSVDGGDGVENDEVIPNVGGTFRMWSDYRMAMEGRAEHVQASTLLSPVLEFARTIADSFRRRWASGGQYPERILARVRLVERTAAGHDRSRSPPPSPNRLVRENSARLSSSSHSSGVPKAGEEAAVTRGSLGPGRIGISERREGEVTGALSPVDGVQEREGRGEWSAASALRGDGSGSEDVEAEGSATSAARGDGSAVEDVERDGQREVQAVSPPPCVLRHALPRLDELDSGALVERALEDLQEEENRPMLLTSPEHVGAEEPSSVKERMGSLRGALSEGLADVGVEAPEVAASLGILPAGAVDDPGSLSATLGSNLDDLTAASDSAEPADEEAVEEATLVGAENGPSEGDLEADAPPTTEKFMLPGWHYLFFSGRSISFDIRWMELDLVLMQDPTARQGRDSGKNVLALRSSGALKLDSNSVGESLDATLDSVSLLPCFYTESAGDQVRGEHEKEEEGPLGTDSARRLALLLGGNGRISTLVARTWLGQGLVAAGSRPLLEPFTVQVSFGTVVVAQAVRGGRGTGTTDARKRRASLGSFTGDDYDRSTEGRTDWEGANAEDMKERDRVQKGKADSQGSGEMVGGVLRVAISELQLLTGRARLKESSTVEIEVDGLTRSFQAAQVLSSSTGDIVEVEFLCRCRLRRRRGRRRRPSVDGSKDQVSASASAVPAATAFDVHERSSHRSNSVDMAGSGGGQRDEIAERGEGTDDEDEDAAHEAKPEAAVKVRLRAPDGKLLGEAWVELPGAPDDWARYPLYSPGAVGVGQATGLERGGVIPTAPATVRRRWGWAMSTRRSGAVADSAQTARSRLWFRPRKPRDVAGEVKLRLAWVPSGLMVTVHGCRNLSPTVLGSSSEAVEGGTAGGDGRSATVRNQRWPIVVRANPGGGAKLARPVKVGAEDVEVLSSAAAIVDGESSAETSVAGDNRLKEVEGGEVFPETEQSAPDVLFFFLDPTCLLGGMDLASATIGDGGDKVEGTGATLLLTTVVDGDDVDGLSANDAADALQGEGRGSSTLPAASSELLMFPGADSARRWVTLVDAAGDPRVDLDMTVAWALAPPDSCSTIESEVRPLASEENGEGSSPGERAVATAAPLTHDEQDTPGDTAITSGTGADSRDAKESSVSGGRGAVPGDRENGLDRNRASMNVDVGDEEDMPEPAQVISRCFSIRASNMVMRVSDLDVAVLVTMGKGIARILRPPKSKEERELELEAVQQRLLEEANSKRNAAIQQLRDTFRHTSSGDETASSSPGDEKVEELLRVRDVVELLRDFLRAKALTESEINREAEEFMLVVMAVADEAKGRTSDHWRPREASSTSAQQYSPYGVRGGPIGSVTVGVSGRNGGTLLPNWQGDGGEKSPLQPEASSFHDGIEGFICPQCRKELASPAALLAHFYVLHEDCGGFDDESDSENSERFDGGGGGRESRGSSPAKDRKVRRSKSRSGGASISLDHFILALQSFMEEHPHEGYVLARCEEFASEELERVILDGFPSLPHRLAAISPVKPLPEFWDVMEKEVGATSSSGGGQQARVLQMRMVRAFKSYTVARLAWAHLVVPALFSVPRCGGIRVASGRTYLPMPCPVLVGQPFYVDKPSMVITHLPPALVGGVESEEGIMPLAAAGGTGVAAGGSQTGVSDARGVVDGNNRVLLTGIMTHSKDRDWNGIRMFLTFSVDKPAVVYVCYDQRLKRLPVWLMYFEKTNWVVNTTEAPFGVWRKRYSKGRVRLGCNDGWRKGCANYFILVGADYPAEKRSSPDGGSSAGGSIPAYNRAFSASVSRSSSGPPFEVLPLPPPPRAPRPRGLLSDGDSGDADGATTARWVLRPHAVAGGKGSLAQAVRALVDETKKSRAKSRTQLLPGGTTRAQLDAAAATAAELGLELAPVELQYRVFFSVGNVSFRVVDPSAAHVKAETHLSHASGTLELRHLHPGDWLGRPDSLVCQANAGGGGTYYNPLVDAKEYFVEPWSGSIECHSETGEPTTQLRVEVPEHAVVNVTSALVENIKTIATLVARNWRGRYTEPPVGPAIRPGASGTLLIRNNLGVDTVIRGLEVVEGCTWEEEDRIVRDDDDDREDIGMAYDRDLLSEKVVNAGQAVEFRLSASMGWRDEIAVHVPGFEVVSDVELRSRGAFAYPLIENAAYYRLKTGAAAGARTAANIGKGLALVVDVREQTTAGVSSIAANGQGALKDPSTSTAFVGRGLVAELRTNVSLHNTSASELEVDMGQEVAAQAAVEAGTGVALSENPRHGRARKEWPPGKWVDRVVRVAPDGRLALPPSVLASWRLRIVGDATEAGIHPLPLTPAMLDPTVPNALRITGDMERNSICLRPAKSSVRGVAGKKVVEDVANAGKSAAIGALKRIPAGGVNSRVSSTAIATVNASAVAASSALSEAALSSAASYGSLSPRMGSNGNRRSRRGDVSSPDSPQSSVGSMFSRDQEESAEMAASRIADWILVVHPPLIFTNALPCAMEVELLQREDVFGNEAESVDSSISTRQSRGSRGSVGGTSERPHTPRKPAPRNPAMDLFFLPRADSIRYANGSDRDVGVNVHASVEHGGVDGADAGKRSSSPRGGLHVHGRRSDGSGSMGNFKSVWKKLVGSGQDAKVGRIDKSRPLYVRLRLPDPVAAVTGRFPADKPLPPCFHWSDYLLITTSDYARRSYFNSRQPEDITWHKAAREDWGRSAASAGLESGKSRRQLCPDIKAARSWSYSSGRRVTFYAPYWIVNKTGLALNYRARYPQKSAFSILSTTSSTRNQASAGSDLDSSGSSSHLSSTHIDHEGFRRISSGSPEQGVFDPRDRDQRSPVSSAEEAALAQVSRLLLREATYVGDEENLDFFGGRSIPVMLGCPDQTLEVMPYAVAGRAENPGLCVCDLQVESDNYPSLYYCAANPVAGSPLYSDCAVRVKALPDAIAEVTSKSGSVIQILTPWRESPAPDKESFLTFWLTRDAVVHVCMDSRTPPGKLPPWLQYAGFRKMPGVEVYSSEPGLRLQVFQRFFRARTLVKIGGSDNSRDLAHALTELSGSVNPDGPAPKGMLANYALFLTTVVPRSVNQQIPPLAPPLAVPSLPLSPASLPLPSELPSPLERSSFDRQGRGGGGWGGDAWGTMVSARVEEADVRDALVDRDMGESILCRWRYRILPGFSPGDCPYVDRDYTIPSLPEEMQGLRLTCIQTAQGDKRAGGSRLLRLSLMQDSVVMVVFDARATSVPLWLAASGFVLWEGVEVAGAEYKTPYTYKVYRKRCPTGLVWLGGNGGKGSKGAKRGYFVLVHVADRSAPAPTPTPQPQSQLTPLTPLTPLVRNVVQPPGVSPCGSEGRFVYGGRAATDVPSPAPRDFELSDFSSERSVSSRLLTDIHAVEVGDAGASAAVNPSPVASTPRSPIKHPPFKPVSFPARSRSFDCLDLLDSVSYDGGGRVGAQEFGGGGPGGPGGSNSSAGNLQRISALWDTEKDGPVTQMPVPLDRVGRRWSRKFNVDAAKTAGPLETSGATLGVSVSALTGQFHRTRVVTLYPRLIVRNFMGFPLEVMPTVMSPKAGEVNRLSQCIPPSMPSLEEGQSPLRSPMHSHLGVTTNRAVPAWTGERNGDKGETSCSTGAVVGGIEHILQTVPTSSAVIVYGFNPVDRVVKGLAAARGFPVDASAAAVAGDVDDRRKCVLIRATAEVAAADDSADVAGETSRRDTSRGGFGEALGAGLSRPILAEEMGETHLWVMDSRGRRHLAAAFVSLQRATIFLTISASGQFPPFRIENRSSAETLAYRQIDAHRSMGWHVLRPLSWHTFLWQEPDKPRAIEVAYAGAVTSSSYYPRHSQEYSLDKIGEREPLEEDNITRAMLALVATGTRVKRLSSEVRVEGRTRVLSFGDVHLSEGHAQGVHADSVTRFKRLYTQLDVGVRLAGLSFNIVECSSEGPSEVMSAHVDSVTVAKRSGGNPVEVQIFHVQVDDMRKKARMPVVVQPTGSGFNSHLRGGDGWGQGPARPVPFLRVLYESEVAAMSMPHLKSLDIDLQELRTHIDLEFVLHVLGLAGNLVPELTSEEVLSRMCRKKAKVAVRHTVLTPAKRDLSMVYVEAFRHSPIVVRVELLVGPAALSPDAVALEDPEATTGGLTVLGGSSLTVLSVLGSSLAHVNPTFVFDELVVTHYCGSMRGLIGLVLTALTQQAVAQGYKVLGSMELLGDPLSLVSKVGDSVVQFFQKTKAEMTGDADTMGAGARVLVKGLVGGTFGSAAKITGSLEEMIRGLSGTEMEMDYEEGQGEVKDLEHGVKEGGKVFYESMRAGLSGLIDRPKEGAREEGFGGLIAGMAKGIVGAVAAPVAGALGAVSRVTEGVDASTRLSDEKSMGRRRAARTPAVSAATAGALAPLTPTDLVKHVPRTFAALWVDAASGYPSVGGVMAGSGIAGDVDGGGGASAETGRAEERPPSGSVTDQSKLD